MCDYSLTQIRSRPAAVGDRLVTKDFGTGTRGFADKADLDCAVCVMPGTEIAFDAPVVTLKSIYDKELPPLPAQATFRQVQRDMLHAHHDALEFADGTQVLLTALQVGQSASVLQMPAAPKTAQEFADQRRVKAVS